MHLTLGILPCLLAIAYASGHGRPVTPSDGLKDYSPPTTIAPPPPIARRYKPGAICSFHLSQWWLCNHWDPDSASRIDLFAEITMYDPDHNIIYDNRQHPKPGDTKNPWRMLKINDGDNASIQPNNIPYDLHLTGEQEHDYIQFNYGGLAWTNKDMNSKGDLEFGYCDNGGWDPYDGAHTLDGHPKCVQYRANHSIRQMDCYFLC